MSFPILNFRRREEELAHSSARTREISVEPLIGIWVNTNTATRGIVKAILSTSGHDVKVQVFGSCSPEPCDWGEAKVGIFAAAANSNEAMAWNAFYNFGFMETYLQSHIRQGVLIIAKFDRFKDNSGRSNYFSKEFFFRTET